MSDTLKPRKVDGDAVRQWHQNAATLMRRGLFTWVIPWWLLVLAAVTLSFRHQDVLLLVAVAVLGPMLQDLLMDAAKTISDGKRSPSAVLDTFTERLLNLGYWTTVRNWIALMSIAAVGVLGFVLLKNGDLNPRTLKPIANFWAYWTFGAIAHFSGRMEFRPWLKRGMILGEQDTRRLQEQARNLNPDVFRKADRLIMLFFLIFRIGGLMLIASHLTQDHWILTAILAMIPIAEIYMCFFLHSAWQDIFQGGIKNRERVKIANTQAKTA